MYTKKVYGKVPLGTPAADSFLAAAVHSYSEVVLSRMQVSRLAIVITTTVVSTANVVVRFYHRPLVGSAAGAVTLGSLNIPTTTAAGKVVYKDIDPVSVPPGSELAFEVITIAAGGGAAGAGIYVVEAEQDPEYKTNETTMVASS